MTHTIPILMYHQIDRLAPRGTPLRGLSVSPSSFARQMALLKLLGYRGVSMRELEPYWGERQPRQSKVIGLTFDDGYRNNLEYALPILQKHGFTATCYAVSAPPHGMNSWDAAKGIPQKPLFTPDDMRTWVAGGMEIGAHSRHHLDLTTLSHAQALDEIAGCKQELEAILGHEVRHFCYPYGHFRQEHCALVRQAGYVSATTTTRAHASRYDDPFQLPRIMIAGSNHLLGFWWKVLMKRQTLAPTDQTS